MASAKSFDDSAASGRAPLAAATSGFHDATAMRVVTFHVGENLYALDINAIREIRRLPSITALPGQPEFVEGVITLRGEVIPVLDLARRMNITLKNQTPESRSKRKLIIGFVEKGVMGFIVDSVSMPDTIKKSEISPPGDLFKDTVAPGGYGNATSVTGAAGDIHAMHSGQRALVIGLVQRPNAALQNDRLLILLDLSHVWGAGASEPLADGAV